MITTSHDDNDRVIGFIEWRQVGRSGFDKFHGEYVWVADMWIHDDYRRTNVFHEMIEDILDKAHDARFCYFTHRKYNDRMSKVYTREQFERLVKKVEKRWEVSLGKY
jgi:GNAT superfamily N-acetyltransferase